MITFNYSVSCVDCGVCDDTIANYHESIDNQPQTEIWLCQNCADTREEEEEEQ